MKLTIQRSALLKPLQMISGVVEKRQTLPILANVLLDVKDNKLYLTATDLEIELIGNAIVEEVKDFTAITVSARKLLDICRALPEDSIVELIQEKEHMVLRSGRSRFLLTTLPAQNFPAIEQGSFTSEFVISQAKFKKLISNIYFAMGQQDVRHYLNGALFDINQGVMNGVATDGHRLAWSSVKEAGIQANPAKIILPRKSVLELARLLDANNEENIAVSIGDNHFRVQAMDFVFTSKLINAQYPDYSKLIPRKIENIAIANRDALKQALTRASILSSEKFRGIRLQLETDTLKIMANNPEQEEAEEMVHMKYEGNHAEIGFNAAYLLDVVSAIGSEDVRWSFSDPSSGVLFEAAEKEDSLYVVMPMRL